jgi:phage terminase large subunit
MAEMMNKKSVDKHSIIFGDSAEPKTIEEIRRSGFAIKPVTKGADSIRFGIQILQDYQFRVTKRSTNIIKELRYYVWDTNKQGEELKKPIDDHNHCLDAARYFAMMKLNKTKQFYVV